MPRPYLGVATTPLTPAEDAQLRLPANTGVRVGRVAADSPAARAGLLPGDGLTKVDGQVVRGESGPPTLLLVRKPGETVRLALLRGGMEGTVAVTLAQVRPLMSR